MMMKKTMKAGMKSGSKLSNAKNGGPKQSAPASALKPKGKKGC